MALPNPTQGWLSVYQGFRYTGMYTSESVLTYMLIFPYFKVLFSIELVSDGEMGATLLHTLFLLLL